MRIVIIGGGIAGTTAAEELHHLLPSAEITLVSEEFHPLYSRVLLTPVINGKVPRERVFLKKEAWYQEQNIEWLSGCRVVSCDPKNAFVALSDGRELPFDALLIASGGEARLLPEDRRGVMYLRTVDDADHIMSLLTEKPVAPAVIYGGGLIACEFLHIFSHHQHPITCVLRSEHFWSGHLLPEAGALLNRHLQEQNIRVIQNAKSIEMIGEKELAALRVGQEEIPCGLLGVGIGVAPDLDWIKAAGIECGVGVKTNEFLETNVPNIFAAGDVTEYFDPVVGRHLHVGTWQNAMTQGRTVAKTIAGGRTAFGLVPSYAVNILGLEVIFVGDVERKAADEIQMRGSVDEGGMTQIHVRDGKVVGGVMLNQNQDRMPIMNAVQEGKNIDDLFRV